MICYVDFDLGDTEVGCNVLGDTLYCPCFQSFPVVYDGNNSTTNSHGHMSVNPAADYYCVFHVKFVKGFLAIFFFLLISS